jgi:dihydroorotate dehydrogenase (NAD+) catalytic subunit
MGGIESGADAIEFLAAGARAIAVGTANFRDPMAAERVVSDLSDQLLARGMEGRLGQIVGSTST